MVTSCYILDKPLIAQVPGQRYLNPLPTYFVFLSLPAPLSLPPKAKPLISSRSEMSRLILEGRCKLLALYAAAPDSDFLDFQLIQSLFSHEQIRSLRKRNRLIFSSSQGLIFKETSIELQEIRCCCLEYIPCI